MLLDSFISLLQSKFLERVLHSNGLFGLRETRRKERGRRESWENILLSIVWFAIKKGRKENIWLGPTQKVFLPKPESGTRLAIM
jgi:hypothetical protein